jgi:hypothetical protein
VPVLMLGAVSPVGDPPEARARRGLGETAGACTRSRPSARCRARSSRAAADPAARARSGRS